jgi:hypothetical protein
VTRGGEGVRHGREIGGPVVAFRVWTGPLRVGIDLRYDGGVEGRNRDIYGWRLGYGVEGGGRGCG